MLLTPTTAVPAFAAEGPPPTTIAGEDLVSRFGAMQAGAMSVPFTMLANLCWNPACSVPAGLSSEGLPVGLQIMGRRHADDVVLRLARLFELAQPWPRHAPFPDRPGRAGKTCRVGDVSRVAEVTGSRYGANLVAR